MNETLILTRGDVAALLDFDSCIAAVEAAFARYGEGKAPQDEIIVFDSTGTALQDVAVAAAVYERALAAGAGTRVNLGVIP